MAERTLGVPEQDDQFAAFLQDAYSTTPEEDLQFQRFVAGENAPQLPSAPGNLREVFSAGFESGAQGLAADLEYFKALGNTLLGNETAAASNIQEARLREEFAAAPLEGVESFSEFLDQPTFDGFVTQIFKGTGQLAPSALLSIASAGTGAVTAIAGRAVLNQVNKQAAKRIIQDSVERTAKGVADPTEREIAELAYGSLRTAATRGAIGGAFAAEYAPLSGSNLSEALDSGQPLDEANALRAAAIGIPQAAIGVGSEYALLRLIGKQATKRAAVEGGVFSNLAKRIGTGALAGGAIEGTTEVLQEGISVANRADLDPLFTAEDAKMRLAEAAFMGFFGGAAPGGAGGAVGGVLDAAPVAGERTKKIFEKARGMIQQAQGQRVNDQINEEQFGDIMSGVTTPEPESDINAQIRAMQDETSGKRAVWVAGTEARYQGRPNEVKSLSIGGELGYAAFIPGRGTIISGNRDLVEAVVDAGASDESLQIALGYSAPKKASEPGDLVVQVLDRDGRVVSEEATTQGGLPAAFDAARKLMPQGGSVQQTTVEKALEDRKRRFEAERPVEVRDIEFTDEQLDELRTRMQAVPDEGQVDQTEDDQVDQFAPGIQAVEGQRTVVRAYGRKADPARTFDNTAQARANFEAAFGETNWGNPRFAAMTEAMLNAAANEQRANPDSAVSIEDTPDGGFQLVRDDFGDLFNSIDSDGNQVRLNLPAFLKSAIQRARQSKYARNSRVTIVGPDGKKSAVNLVDLTAAGQRLLEGREGTGFQMRQDRRTGDTFLAPEAAARAGLLEILGDLAIEGYDVQIDGQSLFPGFQLTSGRNPAANNRIPAKLGNVTAAIIGGRQRSLNELLRPANTPQMTAEERAAALEAEAIGPPQDDIADGRSEIDRMIDSSVEGGELLTRMNIDTPRSAIDRRAGSAPSTINPERATERVSRAIDNMVSEIIRDLFDALKLQSPPRIFTFAELDAMSVEQLEAAFPKGLAAVKQALASMREKPSNLGKHISGEFGKIIVFRESGNTLQDAMVIAHEIGHSLYKEERDKALTNKALRGRLINAYENSPTFKGLSEKYGFDGGFEEWFSDQVALWASKRYKNRQAKNMVEKYFKDFVARLSKLWRATSEAFQKRFSQKLNQDFDSFMDSVIESRKTQVKDNGLSFTQKALVYEINDMAMAAGSQQRVNAWERKINQFLKKPGMIDFTRLWRTADGVMRMYSPAIADMMYGRSQDPDAKGRQGFLVARSNAFNRWKSEWEKVLPPTLDPAERQRALEQARDASIPTDQLQGKAQEIRQYLERIYDEYIAPSNTNIARRENYFPTALNLLEISNDPQGFANILLREDPSLSPQQVQKSIDSLLRIQQAITDDVAIQVDPTNPAADVEEAIRLTANIANKNALGQFLLDPELAVFKYVSHVTKRVEWNRATKDEAGNDVLADELKSLGAEDRAVVEEILNVYLGYQTKALSPFWRKLNSWGQFIQFVAILPFAVLSSLTDLAGPIIASKEFSSFSEALKEISSQFKNRKEAEQFARDLGVTTSEGLANVWASDAEADYMDPKARELTDKYFNLIGLNQFTRFSREFAAGMGVRFIIKHAKNEFNNPRADRYLAELGLDRATVQRWLDGGQKMSTPEGQKVADGVRRFVQSSILSPNAAERPIWASDPHWALVWQLKGYFYSMGKVIIGGFKREAASRIEDGGNSSQEVLTAAAFSLMLPVVALMPLAMLGMELREYAKYGMAWLLPGIDADQRYFKSDRMDWPEYLAEAFNRTGLSGPMAIVGGMNQSAEWGQSPLFSLLGPTAETIETALTNGWRVDRTLKDRLLPGYAVL